MRRQDLPRFRLLVARQKDRLSRGWEGGKRAGVGKGRRVPDAERALGSAESISVEVGVADLPRLEMKNALGIHQVVFIRMLYFLGSNGSCHLSPPREGQAVVNYY